jgi:lipopolysaccharide transport system ATP-binding protein
MTTVIKAENISKQYRLGYVGSGSIKDDVKRWWYGIRGKEDPLLTVGESNDRTRKGESDYVWALKDINFEIQQGDTVGIIGRNGAGKSTLLKLLSKVTAPTTGNIKVKGRIASLLEVGTGFHGELTGRENIYLNGAIMGMRKHEITRRLDEIVDFAGVERYLDTPVKRYSSGMYVRLGFAVAAHLDNEILIVDEVLAVGDASFQTKSMGKLEHSSKKDGKTIIFVSHNMGQITSLCSKAILFKNGALLQEGNARDIVYSYQSNEVNSGVTEFLFSSDNTKDYSIMGLRLLNSLNELSTNFAHDEEIVLEIRVYCRTKLQDVLLAIQIYDMLDRRIFTSQKSVSAEVMQDSCRKFRVKIPSKLLTPKTFSLSLGLHIPNITLLDFKPKITTFSIYDNGSEFYKYDSVDYGVIFANCSWESI